MTDNAADIPVGINGFGRIGRTLGTYMQPLVDRVMYFDPPRTVG